MQKKVIFGWLKIFNSAKKNIKNLAIFMNKYFTSYWADFFEFDICDWIWEKPPLMHNYKYI